MNGFYELEIMMIDGTEKIFKFKDKKKFSVEKGFDHFFSITYDGNLFICNAERVAWIYVKNNV